jgi:hypothetical protein
MRSRVLQQGQFCEFRFGDRDYALLLARLENNLIGQDWAVVHLSTKVPEVVARIAAVLQELEQSRLAFTNDGERVTARRLAAQLRTEHGRVDGRFRSFAEFVDEVAKGPLAKDGGYRRDDTGRAQSLVEWLKATDEALQAGGSKR